MMDVTSAARLADPPDRSRADALRRRVAEEMSSAGARWRLTWLLPLNALVVAFLIWRGESRDRAAIQLCVLGISSVLFVLKAVNSSHRVRVASFCLGSIGYFTFVATTGGLGSPFLIMGAMMVTAAAIAFRDPAWVRGVIFVAFLAGFLTLALLVHTPVGRLAGPLEPQAGWPSPEFAAVQLVAAVFTMVGVYRLGCAVTRGYERAAVELAERREEICSESEDRTRALEGVAARLAHEVKNPLAAIKALSAHMARNASDPKSAERLAIVAAEADRLQTIVEGFVSFSQGLDDLKVGQARLFELTRELAVLLETRAQDAGVSIDVTGDEALVVEADGRKVRQALLNLVLNAIQASPKGSRVRLDVAADAEGARITVADDGEGMTTEVLERIRKPHFTTKEGGTGLGVAVARGLIEQHGGRLEFKSAAGRGTTATVRLPARALPRGQVLPDPCRRSSAGGCPGAAMASAWNDGRRSGGV